MQSSYWGYWLIVLGVAIVGLSISVQGMTTSSTQDYYSIKEITDASMLESVDYGYYRDYNEVKINKEKFIEVFTRMLVETMGANDTYEVNFYEIYEAPPKVSVEVKSNSGANFTSANYDTISRIDAIIQIHAEQVKGNGSVNNNVNEDEDQTNTSSGTTSGNNDNGGSTENTGNNNSTGGSTNSTTNNSTNSTESTESNTGSTGSTSGSTNGNTGGNTQVASSCQKDIKWQVGSGKVHGTSLASGANANIYATFADAKAKKNKIGTAIPGVKFEILGQNERYWAISYNGKCGWVDDYYMAISMTEFLPSSKYNIKYNITNASASIYKVFGQNIAGITGKQLYDKSLGDFVPLVYTYAITIRDIVTSLPSGYKLVIYDAYRPASVSSKVYKALANSGLTANSAKQCSSKKLNCYNGSVYMSLSWYIANKSTHNKACALDLTLEKNGKVYETTYSRIHELSARSNKYTKSGYQTTHNVSSKYYTTGYSKNSEAQELDKIMMRSGVRTIPSEWWHFEETACTSRIGYLDFTKIS